MLFRLRFEQLAFALFLSLLSLDCTGQIFETGRKANAAGEETKINAPLEKKYTQAVEYFHAARYEDARTLFEQIWFSAGAYKDTQKFLDQIKKRTAKASESSPNEEDAILPGMSSGKPARGGQAAGTVSGGISSAERISRLMIDARRSYDDGDFDAAAAKFSQALQIDHTNPEARKYLSDIERAKGTARFSPGVALAELPKQPSGILELPSAPKQLKNEKVVASAEPVSEMKSASTADAKASDKQETSEDKGSDSEKAPAVEKDSTPGAKPAKVVKQRMGSAVIRRVGNRTEVAFAPSRETSIGEKPAVQAFATPIIDRIKSAAELARSAAEAVAKSSREVASAKNAKVQPQPAEPIAISKPQVPAKDEQQVASAVAASRAESSAVLAKDASAEEKLALEPSLALNDESFNKTDDKSSTKAEKSAHVEHARDEKVETKKATESASNNHEAEKPAVAQKSGSSKDTSAKAESKADSAKSDSAKPEKNDAAAAVEPKTESEKTAPQVASASAEANAKPEVKPETKDVAPKSAGSTDSKPEVKSAWSVLANPILDAKQELKAPSPAPAAAGKDVANTKSEKTKSNSAKPLSPADIRKLFEDTLKETAATAPSKPANMPNLPADKITGTQSAHAVANKEARELADSQTKEGVQLFNDGKYAEALEKFSTALASDPSNKEADEFKSKSLKKIESSNGHEEKVVAQAADAKLPPISAIQSLGSALNDGAQKDGSETKSPEASDKKTEDATASGDAVKNDKPADPQAEADKMLRQAQRELAQGHKDEALRIAREARAVDNNNVEIRSLVAELEGPAPQDANAGPAAHSDSDIKSAKPMPDRNASDEAAIGVDGLLTEARNKFESGRPQEALASFKAVLEIDPGNPVAKRYISQIQAGQQQMQPSSPGGVRTQVSAVANNDQAEAAFQKGLVAYEAGRLDVAVQWWNYTLTLQPNHPRAVEYLQNTRGEYDAWVQQHQYNAVTLQKESSANEKLDTPVTYDTAGQKSIVEFLSAMSLITDVSFYVADGVDPEIRITAKFEDTPLHDALDIVLLPIGLKWSRTQDVVTITPDLRTKFFNLSPDQVTRLKTLLDNKTLQRILYGPEGSPVMRNVELTLDDRENILLVTDSQENINKVEAFLKEMQLASPPGLVYKSWKIRREEGQKIKALVEAIVKVQSDAPYDLDRKVVVDNDDLIVKDTQENISKIEELLLDKNFIKKLETQKLDVQTYNLTPREPIQENVEQVRDFAQNVVTVAKTILYSQSTESAAAAEGRRYWYDPNTLQLTVTDYPENLRVLSDYIRSLPMLGKKQKSDIIFLKHQTAGDLSTLLNTVLGLTGETAAAGGATGESVTRTLRVEGELVFRDIRIRVTKVNENDVNDDNDDSVEMVVRTATNSEDRTIDEFHSEFIDNYEINVIEVRPSGTPGEGSAKIEIRLAQTATGVAGAGLAVPGAIPGAVPVGVGAVPGAVVPGQPGVGVVPGVAGAVPGALPPSTEAGIQIESIENMNALLIRYEDPGDLAEVKGWIEQLDIPVLQVNIETKLVEVNENRAKEFMPQFDIAGLGKGRGPDWSQARGSSRFAQFEDEFHDPFDPLPEYPSSAGLLKGTQVFDLLVPGSTTINFELRTLESEGVVNIVNGPHVVVENGESADFEIERRFANATLDNTNQNTNNTNTGFSGNSLQQVQMTVTPQITQLGEIRLDIQDLELQDFGDQISNGVATTDINANGSTDNFEPRGYPASFPGSALNFFDIRRRSLQTVARVHNGGTIVLGGWTQEHSRNNDSGVPILRNLPYIGKLFFGRTSDRIDRTTLLIFLTCNLIEP
jgi:type II secretory pathway component GspD/PulD (secretin)/tetratricopeptide (TPR) repeat protein